MIYVRMGEMIDLLSKACTLDILITLHKKEPLRPDALRYASNCPRQTFYTRLDELKEKGLIVKVLDGDYAAWKLTDYGRKYADVAIQFEGIYNNL